MDWKKSIEFKNYFKFAEDYERQNKRKEPRNC